MPKVPSSASKALDTLIADGVTWGDSSVWLPKLPRTSVDLFYPVLASRIAAES